jgi:anti-sigma factor RsiW
MSDDSCRGKREDIGAYVLGGLDDNRTTALLAHLDGCPSCRAEADELGAVARMLPLAAPLRSTDAPMPPARLAEAIVRRVRTEQRNSRRQRLRRATAVGVGVAAALVALLAYFAITAPDVVEIDIASATTTAQSHAALEYLPGGTRVSLSVEGLPEEQTFGVWLEKKDGERVPAGSFYTPEDGELQLTFTAAIRLKDCAGIGVSDSDGETVLYAELH